MPELMDQQCRLVQSQQHSALTGISGYMKVRSELFFVIVGINQASLSVLGFVL